MVNLSSVSQLLFYQIVLHPYFGGYLIILMPLTALYEGSMSPISHGGALLLTNMYEC